MLRNTKEDAAPPTKSIDKATFAENYKELREHTVVVQRRYYIVNSALWTDQRPFKWREYNRSELMDALAAVGWSRPEVKRHLSSLLADPAAKVVDEKYCLESYPLRAEGYQEIDGEPCFVKRDSSPLMAVQGDPLPAIRMIVRMFHEEADLMLGWLQGAYKRQLNYAALCRGEKPPFQAVASQTLCLAGLQDTGKTMGLLECIVSVLLGGYEVIPESWLVGNSTFADWQFRSALYVCDDSPPIATLQDRRALGRRLKTLGYPNKVSMECKGKGALSRSFPNTRYFACNTDPESLRALPEISAADSDKYLVLYICAPCGKVEDYGGDSYLMQKTVKESIPAFAWWLLKEYTVPEWAAGTEGTRHTVANYGPGSGYVSPHLRDALMELNGCGILMNKLRSLYTDPQLREAYVSKRLSLGELREALTKAGHVDKSTDKEFGAKLSQCAESWPHLLKKGKSSSTWYLLHANKQWNDAMDTQSKPLARHNPIIMKVAGLTVDDLAPEAGLAKKLLEPVTPVTANSGEADRVGV